MEEEPKKKAPVKRAVKAKKTETKTDEKSVAEVMEEPKSGSWIYALGRRKTSIAKVRLIKNGKGTLTVNGKALEVYFGASGAELVRTALKTVGQETAVDVIALAQGGGMRGQAEAVRLGLCRALIELNPTYRTTLKKMGFLTRDPRSKERKKFGLRKARRAPQWSKR